jgi:aryl-alcohol dehydrogenase-like predicted oxidoreductase
MAGLLLRTIVLPQFGGEFVEYVNLGSTGLKVSRICLGTMNYGDPGWRSWVLPAETANPLIQHALELGINFFDTANMYSLGASECVLGSALNKFARRDEVVIATKVFWPMGDDPNQRGLSRKHIMDAIDASLQRLNTDYVDLYYIHRWDDNTPLEESLEALNDIVKDGKARYVGASSMRAWQFAKALYLADLHGWTRFVAMQNHHNLVYREEEREMIPLCVDQRVGILPWSPLAAGFLAGNWPRDGEALTVRSQTDTFAHRAYRRECSFDILDRVGEIADQHGVFPAKIAVSWLLHQPSIVSPVIGASKRQHIEDAAAALDIELTDQEIDYLEEPYRPHPNWLA